MLNWLLRYAPVVTFLRHEFGTEPVSILDVGCGPLGLACALPQVPFVGVDIAFEGTPPPTMVAVRTSPGPLPFLDRTFDVVVCLDALEHVPPPERQGFVAELGRVCAARLLLACPSDESAWTDAFVRAQYERSGVPAPPWLNEHDEYGLPSASELEHVVSRQPGFVHRRWRMVNNLLSILIALGDVLPEFAPLAADEWERHKERWLPVFQAAEFGTSARKGFVLERQARSPSRIAPDSFLHGALAALVCRACGATHSVAGQGRAECAGCGRTMTRNERGVWEM